MFDINGQWSLDFYWPNARLAIHEDFTSGSGGAVQTYSRKEYDEDGREVSLWDSPMIQYQPCSSAARSNQKLNLSLPDGRFSLIGQYDSRGRRTGNWIQSSAFNWQGSFLEGEMDGPWSATGPHGSEAGSFVLGKRHGHWTISKQYEVRTGQYQNGQRQGTWINAQKTNTGSWNDPNWVDSSFQYQTFESDLLVHETIVDASGNTLEIKEYAQGKPSGLWLTFYLNGVTRSAARYHEGLLNGALTEYEASGEITKVETYKNGLLDGESTLYSNGRAYLRSSFLAGSMTARTVLFDAKAGILEAEKNFKRALALRKNAPALRFFEIPPNEAPSQFETTANISRWLTIKSQSGPGTVEKQPFKSEHVLTLPWGAEIGCVGGSKAPYKIPNVFRLEGRFWVVTENNFSIMSLNEKKVVSLEPFSETRYLELLDR
jgi:antitoxin component YwqK of YwqJK toxin-antitoxin module